MRTEWRAFCVQETASAKTRHDTAHLLWNGYKVAIATQGLFQAHGQQRTSETHR